MINSRRAKFGRQAFKQGNHFQSGKPGKGSNIKEGQFVPKCPHCNKKGHMQLECRTKIKKNAPYMDKDSKSFANQPKVASIEDDEDDQLDESLVRHLNGFIRTVQGPADLIDLNSV
jgi:hypothetical protein